MVLPSLCAAISVICCLFLGSLLAPHGKCLPGISFSPLAMCVNVRRYILYSQSCDRTFVLDYIWLVAFPPHCAFFRAVLRGGPALAVNQGLQLWMFPVYSFVSRSIPFLSLDVYEFKNCSYFQIKDLINNQIL